MLEYLRENFRNQNTVYSENDEFDRRLGHEFHPFGFWEWIERDQKYTAYREQVRKAGEKRMETDVQ